MFRNYITGRVSLRGVMFEDEGHDFHLVDLKSRLYLSGCLKDFENDKYVFRPIPLPYHTWLYHEAYRGDDVRNIGIGETAMLKKAISYNCNNVPGNMGLWSPVMAYAPMSLVATLTGDKSLVVLAVAVTVLCFVVSVMSNCASLYLRARHIMIPPRAAFAVFLALRFQLVESVFGTVAYLAVWAFVLVDVLYGDLQRLSVFKYSCHYEIMQALPNRVFVCKRHGVAHNEGYFRRMFIRGEVDSDLTGTGWSKILALVADVQGILFELRPMDAEEWFQFGCDYMSDPFPRKFTGLDCYNDQWPTFRSIETGVPAYVPEAKGRSPAGARRQSG
jgi:hypothetical protein